MKFTPLVVTAFLLVGCGGSSSNPEDEIPPYSDLESPSPEIEKLSYASSEVLTRLLKNGVRMDAGYVRSSRGGGFTEGVQNDAVGVPQPTPALGDYSETNVQVAGVDEGDHVKYDGSYLYLHTWPDWTGESVSHHGVRILETDSAQATAQEVSQIQFEDQSLWSEAQHYLLAGESHADALVTVQSQGYVPFCGVGEVFPAVYYSNIGSTQILLHNVENPGNPQQNWQLEIEGLLHHTRKIGDVLYLVTSYLPQVDIPQENRIEQGSDSALEAVLDDLSADDLLPGYRINGGEKQLLNTSEECLVSVSNESHHGYRSLHHITAVNLREQRIADSVCLGTPVQGLYSSPNAIYLSASQWSENWESSFTVFHKFELVDEAVNYVATGSVPGHLSGSNPSFRMDEYDGYLRVLTTSWGGEAGLEHRLWILQENSAEQTLATISQLPNEQQPGKIGKPGEDVYAVRFNGDEAYVVTFERIDPLYVLDLSEPELPAIAGELELPGFSTYLHPLGGNYLFGFGRDADTNGRALGLKAALFDVSNRNQPRIVTEINLGQGWSDASYDYKAFSFLRSGDNGMRITFPMVLVDQQPGEALFNDYPNYARLMVMLEISGMNTETPAMVLHGTLQTGEDVTQSWRDFSAFSRGVMHGDAVFYVDEPEVWGALWSLPGGINGPF